MQLSEQTIAEIKNKTCYDYPIGPTNVARFADIAGNDIINVDWEQYDDNKRKEYEKQAYKYCEIFRNAVHGTRYLSSMIACYVYPLPIQSPNDTIKILHL